MPDVQIEPVETTAARIKARKTAEDLFAYAKSEAEGLLPQFCDMFWGLLAYRIAEHTNTIDYGDNPRLPARTQAPAGITPEVPKSCGISSWPEPTKGYVEEASPRDVVVIVFETEMYVAVATKSAVGLKDDPAQREIDYWLPISQIAGVPPKAGAWINTIAIPRWLADEKGLEHD